MILLAAAPLLDVDQATSAETLGPLDSKTELVTQPMGNRFKLWGDSIFNTVDGRKRAPLDEKELR